MPRVYMGRKAGIGSVVKIMGNNADDPRTTPNTDYGKFRFNSETTDYAFIDAIIEQFPIGPSPDVYWPAPPPNHIVHMGVGGVSIDRSRLIARYGFVPIMIYRSLSPGRIYNDIGGDEDVYASGLAYLRADNSLAANNVYGGGSAGSDIISSARGPGAFNEGHILAITRLPALTGLPAPLPPVSGQKMLEISKPSQRIRIAKPGYDASIAPVGGLIISEQQTPVSILGHGVLTSGSTSAAVPNANNNTCILMYHTIDGTGARRSPSYPYGNQQPFNPGGFVQLNGGVVNAPNIRPGFGVEYLVVGQASSGRTSGNGPVMTRAGGRFRLIRPGSSVTPNVADILLDSEYKYAPVVASGVVDRSQFTSGTEGFMNYSVGLPGGLATYFAFMCVEAPVNDGVVNAGNFAMETRFLSGSGPFPWPLDNNYSISGNVITFRVSQYSNFRLQYYVLGVPF